MGRPYFRAFLTRTVSFAVAFAASLELIVASSSSLPLAFFLVFSFVVADFDRPGWILPSDGHSGFAFALP